MGHDTFVALLNRRVGVAVLGLERALGAKTYDAHTWSDMYLMRLFLKKCEIQYFYDAHKVMHIKVNKKTDITVICKIQTKVINI